MHPSNEATLTNNYFQECILSEPCAHPPKAAFIRSAQVEHEALNPIQGIPQSMRVDSSGFTPAEGGDEYTVIERMDTSSNSDNLRDGLSTKGQIS
jgi:hypothetical protein